MSISQEDVRLARKAFFQAVNDLGPLSVWDEIQKKRATSKSVQTDVVMETEGVEEAGA